MEEKRANDTIHFFFRCAGIAMVVLSFKVKVIQLITFKTILSLWYTFLYIFMEAIWFGLATMCMPDLYKYIKRKIHDFIF